LRFISIVALALLGLNPVSWQEGLDPKVLAAFDADIAGGKYGNVDSLLVMRHGRVTLDKASIRGGILLTVGAICTACSR
jgi:hypothetical protein